MRALGVTGRGDRHPAGGHARCWRTSAIPSPWRAGLRRHLRERAGGAAHRLSFPPRQPAAGFVVGTGDLSELALGWCTYGVGDQMSHYNVNAVGAQDADPVPDPLGGAYRPVRRRRTATLLAILDTEISPELVPATTGADCRARRPRSAPTSSTTSSSTTSCASGCAPRRSRSWLGTPGVKRPRRVAARLSGCRTPRLRPGDDPEMARGLPLALLRVQPVQALGACRTAPRSRPAGACRLAATGARRPTATPGRGWTSSKPTCRGRARTAALLPRTRRLRRSASAAPTLPLARRIRFDACNAAAWARSKSA